MVELLSFSLYIGRMALVDDAVDRDRYFYAVVRYWVENVHIDKATIRN